MAVSWAVEAALECVAFFETSLEKTDKLGVAYQAPGSGIDEAWRDLAGKSLDVQVRAQTFQQSGHEVEVSVQGECDELRRARGELTLHGRAAYYLELVELDRVQRQLINNRCVGHLNGPDCVSEGVASVDTP